MRIADSWTETTRAVADVGHLLRFRAGTIRRRRRSIALGAGFLLLTVAIAVVPAFVTGAGDLDDDGTLQVAVLIPSALAGFVVLTIVSAAASGGGRELLARDPATIHPISPTTDHLGALLLAPLNVGFMIQAWALLGVTSFAVGPSVLLPAQIIVVMWVLASVAFAQVLSWSLEGVRRVPHGIVGVRLLTVVVLGVTLGLQLSDNLIALFDQLPTRYVALGLFAGFGPLWVKTMVIVVGGLVVAVVLGAVPAHIASHRLPRDELKIESGQHEPRPLASSMMAALVRTDRASVWRSVPMRRGVLVLALGPAVVALLGNLQWETMTILPGLVASGGALLYGVNAWCLDSRGALWRESLPVSPVAVFDARAYVLGEFLLAASLLTVTVGAVRAGLPSLSELTAIVAALVVVTVQVVAAGMRWSSQRPFAVDLRSARATPAPPATMVGYSLRLAISTTFTGLTFSAFAGIDEPQWALVLAVPFLAWSGTRLLRTRREWAVPTERARVITTVAVA